MVGGCWGVAANHEPRSVRCEAQLLRSVVVEPSTRLAAQKSARDHSLE